MKKQITAVFIFCLCFLVLAGCDKKEEPQKNGTETSRAAGMEINSNQLLDYSNILSDSDEDVVAALGSGDPSYQDEGNTIISTRLYQSNILGFGGETVLIYNEEENPTVHEVLITFYGADFNELIDAISEQLGDAIFVKKEAKNSADAQWKQENTLYSLTSYKGTIMLAILQDYSTEEE